VKNELSSQGNSFGQIEVIKLGEKLDGLLIKHKLFTAKVSLYGGQVLSWQPEGEREVFWLSQDSMYQENAAIRGGIPICWPWFGAFKDGGNHGFARQNPWQLADVLIESDTVSLTLVLTGADCHRLWPSSFALKQKLVFGRQFSQRLYITNLSEETVEYSAALHSYFAISNPEKVQTKDLNEAEFEDKLIGGQHKPQELTNCQGPIDRIYHTNKPVTLVDKGWQRSIMVRPLNTRQWVLWNPGQQTAQSMKDVHQGGEQEFVCLEAANTQWQVINAKETVMIGQEVSVSQG